MSRLRLLQGSDPGWNRAEWQNLSGKTVLDMAYSPVGNNGCRDIFRGKSPNAEGNVPEAMAIGRRGPGFTQRHADYVYSLLQNRCLQIRDIGCKFGALPAKDERANMCVEYVNRYRGWLVGDDMFGVQPSTPDGLEPPTTTVAGTTGAYPGTVSGQTRPTVQTAGGGGAPIDLKKLLPVGLALFAASKLL